MLRHVVRVDFGNIAQKVTAGVERVFPDASGLPPESREAVCDLGKLHVCFRRKLLEHHDALVAYPASVLVELVHLLLDRLGRYVKYIRKCQSVEFLYFLGRDHKVVCHPVSYKDVTVPVVDDAAGRVDGGVHHRVVFCAELVFVFYDLDAEELDYQDAGSGTESYQKFVFPVQFHAASLFSVIR